MVIELSPGRNELTKMIEFRRPLQDILIKGRFLESDFHDDEGCNEDHMHWYKKILGDYNLKTETILLSKKGSRRLLDNLNKPDRQYTRQELYNEASEMHWKVREADHNLF